MKIKLYFLLFIVSTALFSQQNQLTTSIDTTKNKVGAEFKLTLKSTTDTASKVVFPNPKNMGSLEVIFSYPIDTILKDGKYELIKKYGLTQFDSGRYVIPRLKILINKQAFLSDAIQVEVANIVVDTLQQKMYDIKDIVPANEGIGDWWKYLLFILVLGVIGAAIYWFVKKRQTKMIEENVFRTPIEKATNLLNTLEKKELWQKGEVKEYYSELTDIVRNYIEEAIEIPAMESTTSELIAGLKLASKKKKMKLSAETFDNLLIVLQQADLVKFAKSKPLDFEITEDRKKIERAIITLDKAIPVVVDTNEESLLNEMQRQEQLKRELKKKKKDRIVIAVVSVIALLFITSTYFIVTKGFTYVKDNIVGHPSKELLEGEWITSEYGSPVVKVETPQVLKRLDLKKSMPKEGLALLKDMQTFGYGSLVDNFYIAVSTFTYKQEGQIELEKSLDGSIQMIESLGAQNIIMKKENFQTSAGVSGMKAYGTFSTLDQLTKSSSDMFYEIIVFGQGGGLQQIMIMHEEGDTYANQISQRVLSSVELQNTAQ